MPAGHLLGRLVASPGHHNQVAGPGGDQRSADGAPTIGFHERIGSFHSRKDVRDHPRGWFTPRIVRRDDRQVGRPFGRSSHQGALAEVSLAATTENQDQAT